MIGIIIQETLYWFRTILSYCVLLVVILSWFPINRSHFLYKLLLDITDPILVPIRKMLYKSPLGGPGMMIDISPILAMLLIRVVFTIIEQLILGVI